MTYTDCDPSGIVAPMTQIAKPAGANTRGPRSPKTQAGPHPNRIGEVRNRRGWTQAQLSEATGISPSYLKQLEGGHRALTVNIMVMLVNALGCTPEDLCITELDQETTELLLLAHFRMMSSGEQNLLLENAKRFVRAS